MREEHSSIWRQLRQSFEELQLNCGSGKSFDAVNTRGVNQRTLRRFGSEPADIDGEIFSRRTTGGQLQTVELAARFF